MTDCLSLFITSVNLRAVLFLPVRLDPAWLCSLLSLMKCFCREYVTFLLLSAFASLLPVCASASDTTSGIKAASSPYYPPQGVHFGICVALGAREADPDFMLLSHQTISSLLCQKYTNWTLIIVGDNLSRRNMRKVKVMLRHHRIPNRVIIRNINASQTSAAIHARLNETEERPWFNSGTIAFNRAFEIAESLPHVTHIKVFSDDDIMLPTHLQDMQEGYSVLPDIFFSYTCGTNYGTIYPRVGYQFQNPDNDKFIPSLPMPVNTIAAAQSWDKKIFSGLRFRLGFEQEKLRKSWGLEPVSRETRVKWGFEEGYKNMANDAFSYMELQYGYHLTQNHSILCAHSSMIYLNPLDKPALLARLYNSTSSSTTRSSSSMSGFRNRVSKNNQSSMCKRFIDLMPSNRRRERK